MNKEKIPQAVKVAIWNKYIGYNVGSSECFIGCGNLIQQNNFECGHIISEKCGGKVTIQNLRPICNICNKSIGGKNMCDFVKKYGFESKLSEENHIIISDSDIPDFSSPLPTNSKITPKKTESHTISNEIKNNISENHIYNKIIRLLTIEELQFIYHLVCISYDDFKNGCYTTIGDDDDYPKAECNHPKNKTSLLKKITIDKLIEFLNGPYFEKEIILKRIKLNDLINLHQELSGNKLEKSLNKKSVLTVLCKFPTRIFDKFTNDELKKILRKTNDYYIHSGYCDEDDEYIKGIYIANDINDIIEKNDRTIMINLCTYSEIVRKIIIDDIRSREYLKKISLDDLKKIYVSDKIKSFCSTIKIPKNNEKIDKHYIIEQMEIYDIVHRLHKLKNTQLKKIIEKTMPKRNLYKLYKNEILDIFNFDIIIKYLRLYKLEDYKEYYDIFNRIDEYGLCKIYEEYLLSDDSEYEPENLFKQKKEKIIDSLLTYVTVK